MHWRFIPVVLTSFLLGAHFMRDAMLPLTILCVLLPLLLFIKQIWALLVVQTASYISVLIWVSTAVTLTQDRMDAGMPAMRMFIILISVAVFALISGLLLNSRSVKTRYVE